MLAFIGRRVLALLPTLLAISAVTFFMGFAAPGDPITIMLGEKGTATQIDRVKHQYGLDQPPLQQYGRFLGKVLRGDLGLSYAYPGRSVISIVRSGFRVSLKVGGWALLYAGLLGLLLGVLAAVSRGRWLDQASMLLAVLGISLPSFVMAIALMYLFGVKLHWLPVSGWGRNIHYVLPVLVLGTRSMTVIARLTRTAMLDVLDQDYVRTARSKGLAGRVVVYKHALRNALVPVVTVLGLTLGGLVTGAFIVESIFSVPGIGQVALSAIQQRDYPVIQVTTLLFAAVFVLVNLLVDLVYGLIDPRIRYS